MKIPRIQGRDLASLVIALVTLVAVIGYIVLQSQINASIVAQYETLRGDYQGLYEETVQAGVEPSAPPPEDVPVPEPLTPMPEPEPGPSGATGPQGPGPTRAQVREAVEGMFATGEFDGEDGRPPTDAEIDAAVERYCAADTCDGEDGTDGVDGVDGVDGTNGEPGPPPTTEQIGIALAAYCANQPGGSCEGATGEDGSDGEDGTDGASLPVKVGDYTCPDDRPYMSGFSFAETLDDDGSPVYGWAVTCEAFPPVIITP